MSILTNRLPVRTSLLAGVTAARVLTVAGCSAGSTETSAGKQSGQSSADDGRDGTVATFSGSLPPADLERTTQELATG